MSDEHIKVLRELRAHDPRPDSYNHKMNAALDAAIAALGGVEPVAWVSAKTLAKLDPSLRSAAVNANLYGYKPHPTSKVADHIALYTRPVGCTTMFVDTLPAPPSKEG